jgi:hypothetical protein
MAREIITPAAVPSAYADADIVAGWTPSNVADKNRYLWTGRELLELRNVGVTSRACVLTSAPDSQGRTNDVAITLTGGQSRVMPFLAQADGWVQADGYVYFEGPHIEAEWRVLRLP